MISAIIKATKPADARPLIDLAARARDAPGRRSGRLLRRHRLLLMADRAHRGGRCPVRSIAPRDLAALILAATCWGVGTVISKAALAEIPPFTLLPIQLAASLAVLAVLMRRQGISFRTEGSPLLGRLGLLNPGLAYALGLIGLTTITASLYVLLWALEPLMILFLAAWFLRERITPAFVVLSLIAVAGMVVIVYDPSASSGQLIGVGLTLAGIVCCAVYSVVTRRWIPDAKETSQVILSQQAHALVLAIGLVLVVGLAGGQDRADGADAARARQRRRLRASSTTPAPTGSTSAPCAMSRPRTRRSRST